MAEFVEVSCPGCGSKRAIFPEDPSEITCYSCNGILALDRTAETVSVRMKTPGTKSAPALASGKAAQAGRFKFWHTWKELVPGVFLVYSLTIAALSSAPREATHEMGQVATKLAPAMLVAYVMYFLYRRNVARNVTVPRDRKRKLWLSGIAFAVVCLIATGALVNARRQAVLLATERRAEAAARAQRETELGRDRAWGALETYLMIHEHKSFRDGALQGFTKVSVEALPSRGYLVIGRDGERLRRFKVSGSEITELSRAEADSIHVIPQ